jgi:four helix bundle protein
MGNFQKLFVWQNAKNLAVSVYKICQQSKISKDFGLRDQIQRAAVSIPSNIAEGDELGSDKQSVRYFLIAKGSVAELITQIIISNEIGYINDSEKETIINDCRTISVMLSRLIRARSS